MKLHNLILTSVLACGGFAATASAAVVASYPFTGSLNSTDTELNSTASAFGWAYSSNAGLSGAGNVFVRSDVTPGDQALALSGNSYFTFTLTPGAGITLDLTTLTFDTLYNNAGTSVANAVAATYFLRYSGDSFGANIGASFTENYQDTSAGTATARSVDLSALNDITTATEFRIYIYDGSSNLNRTVRLDNVVLNATVIPEPSAALLGSLGLLALLRRRR